MRDRLESRDRSEQWARALLHAILALVGGTFRTIGPADNVHSRQNRCFKFLELDDKTRDTSLSAHAVMLLASSWRSFPVPHGDLCSPETMNGAWLCPLDPRVLRTTRGTPAQDLMRCSVNSADVLGHQISVFVLELDASPL